MAKDSDSDESETDEFYHKEQLRTWRMSAAFRRASFHPPDEIWNLFAEAENCGNIIDYFRALIKAVNIDPSLHGIEFYEILKSKLTSWKCQSLWDMLNARLKHSEYKQGTVAKGTKCIIIGSGPIGLRMAIEALMLGCKTVIVEKRKEFSRNNVLHLWPFLLTDFRALGAKKFYGKFGSGCIDHINIKTLQHVLLKVALLLGLDIHLGVTFKNLIEPTDEQTGWKASFEPENHEVSKFEFDIVIGADGKKNILPGFPQIELRGALAIGITCNFINNNTIEEAGVAEISGISYQFNPTFFNDMEAEYGVKLENIVYYKDETHYFVMTALKASLLNLGVLIEDKDTSVLLDPSNVNKEKLIEFTRYAVDHATNHQLPSTLEFMKLSNGNPDIALFDFTSIKKAANASRIIERKKHRLLLALVGDSLIEPFWPTGSGCGRGVLSAMDVAWMIRQFAMKNPPLAVLRERENIFKLLSGTTNESLQKNYNAFTIDPKTRYSGFDTKKVSNVSLLKGLYDTDDIENADYTIASPVNAEIRKKPLARRRTSSGGNARKTSTHVHLHGGLANKPKRKTDRAVVKEQIAVGDTKQFWEEHNKKNFANKSHIPKNKKSVTSDDGLGIEDISDLEDDVIEPEVPVVRKRFKSRSLKRQASRDDVLIKKKNVFHAKGGGLKSKSMKDQKKSPDKGDTKVRKKSVPSQKSPTRKSQKVPVKEDPVKNNEPVQKKEPPRPVDPRNFFRKWLDTLKAKSDKDIKSEMNEDCPEAFSTCIQTAAIAVMAMPLLFDCNRAPRRRTTDIKVKDLIAAKDFLNPDTKKETEEISLKRAGSVRNTVQKYKMLTSTDKQSESYYDFLKRSRTDTNGNGTDETDFSGAQDFAPKEVIDVERALLENEAEEKKRSSCVTKVTKLVINKLLCFLLALMMFAGVIVAAVHFILQS